MITIRSFRPSWLGIPAAVLLLASGCRGDNPSTDLSAQHGTSEPKGWLGSLASKPVVKTVPAGTRVSLELLQTLASNSNRPGDRFRARVARDVVVGGEVAIPAGSEISGVVTEAVALKKIGGRAKLGLEFTSVEPPSGNSSEIKASYFLVGKSETKKDAATIGGAAAGGALLGRIIGHQNDHDARGTTVGAVVGGAAGTAIAAKTKGQEVVLPSGHVIQVALEAPADVTLSG